MARLAWQALGELQARERASSVTFDGEPATADDDLLFAFPSFAALSASPPAILFRAGLAAGATPARRVSLVKAVQRLLLDADHRWSRYLDDEPRPPGGVERHAINTASLLIMVVAVGGNGERPRPVGDRRGR